MNLNLNLGPRFFMFVMFVSCVESTRPPGLTPRLGTFVVPVPSSRHGLVRVACSLEASIATIFPQQQACVHASGKARDQTHTSRMQQRKQASESDATSGDQEAQSACGCCSRCS